MQNSSLQALGLLLFATLTWGGNIVIGRAIRNDLPPLGLSFWRWLIAFVILLVFTLPLLQRNWPVIRREWRLLGLLALLGLALFHPLQYFSLQSTTVINATLILSTSPAMVALFSLVALKEQLGRVQMLGIVVSFIGVATVISRGDMSSLSDLTFQLGDLWMLLAALVWALYSVTVKFRPADLHPHAMLAATAGLGALLLLPFYLWESATVMAMPFSLTSISVLIYVAVAASLLAYLAFNRGVALVGPARAGIVLHMVPVWATLLAFLFLGERLQGYHIVGLVLIACGIVLSNRPTR